MKYPDDFVNKIIQGDCLEVMKEIPDRSVDLVLTDPPYGMNYKKCIGDESIKLFLDSLPGIYRVLRDDKFFVTYLSPIFLYEIITEAKRTGFIYRWVGFNYYPNMFKQKPQPLGYNRYDMFLILSKGNAKKTAYMKDVVHILMDKNKPIHPHQKPRKALEKLIKTTTSIRDIVLDPFVGSGEVCVVAKEMGRAYIGIEIDKIYYEMAQKRVEATVQCIVE